MQVEVSPRCPLEARVGKARAHPSTCWLTVLMEKRVNQSPRLSRGRGRSQTRAHQFRPVQQLDGKQRFCDSDIRVEKVSYGEDFLPFTGFLRSHTTSMPHPSRCAAS